MPKIKNKIFIDVFIIILSFIALYLILGFFLSDLIHKDDCKCIGVLR